MRKLFIAVSVVVLFISCDTGGMNNNDPASNLVGTWENKTETYTEQFTFEANGAVSTLYKESGDPYIQNGTYQAYDSVIIFRFESIKFFADYTLGGNELTLVFSHNGNTAIYKKSN